MLYHKYFHLGTIIISLGAMFPNNFYLIKYEELVKNTSKEIKNLLKYINKFKKLEIEEKDIDEIVKNSNFSNLKKQESIQGFKKRT